METLKGMSARVGDKVHRTEDNVTQSLDQLIKRKLKETAKNVKRKLDDTLPAQGAVMQYPSQERFASELQASVGRGRVREQAKQMALAMPAVQNETARPATSTVTFADTAVKQAALQTAKTGRVGETERVVPQHHSHVARTSIVSQDKGAPIPHQGRLGDHDLQAKTVSSLDAAPDVLKVMPRNTDSEYTVQSTLKNSSTDMPPTLGEREVSSMSEDDGVAFLSVPAEQPRNTTHVFRASETSQPAVLRQAHTTQAMAAKMIDTAKAESASNGQLMYRFSEWGDGHQVNVQLGGHAKALHVLQASDALVHQRLADYDGQGQSEPEWVFSDEQEQPKKDRRQNVDEETA